MGLLDDLDQLANSQGLRQPSISKGAQEQVGKSDTATALSRRASTQPPPPDSNDYATWSLSDLQREARQYGFREVKERGVLIRQLRQVREALEEKENARRRRQDDAEEDVSMVSSSSSIIMRRSSIGEDLSSDVEEVASMGDLTMEILREAADPIGTGREDESRRGRNGGHRVRDRNDRGHEDGEGSEGDSDRNDQDDGEDDDDASSSENDSDVALAHLASEQSTTSSNEIAPSLSDQLYKAVTADKSLYHRILLFEPVSFDEVSSTAKRAGVTGLRSKETLRNWLDMQGICFYSADLTGQRQRY